MNTWLLYILIAAILVGTEIVFFRIVDKFKNVDEVDEDYSTTKDTRKGGGVIFMLSIVIWGVMMSLLGNEIQDYMPFLCGLLMIAGVSLLEEYHHVRESLRVGVQFIAMGLMFWTLGIMYWDLWWKVLIALVLFVGIMNAVKVMDGINGITAGYSFAVLLPLFLQNNKGVDPFMLDSLLGVSILGVLVFGFYNFRPNGMAKTFAGSVGSLGIAFIILFAIGKLIIKTGDSTWLVFLVVYGVDVCLSIFYQIIRHKDIGQAHRKYAYQLMAHELGMNHVTVSLFYMGLQLVISLIMIYLIPNTAEAHWIYLVVVALVLSVAYILFLKKYYYLFEEYLQRLQEETACRMKITPAILDSLTEQAKALPKRCVSYDVYNSDHERSRRILYAYEPGAIVPIHRYMKASETVICLRGRVTEEFYDEEKLRCTEAIEISPNGPVVALNIPAGQWHTLRVLESGSIIMVIKDGKYKIEKVSDRLFM